VNEIDLMPSVNREGENEDGQLTRQGVRHHLSQLEDLGLVRTEVRNEGNGRGQHVYAVDESAVFGLLENVRELVADGSEVPLDPFRTQSRQQLRPVSGRTAPSSCCCAAPTPPRPSRCDPTPPAPARAG